MTSAGHDGRPLAAGIGNPMQDGDAMQVGDAIQVGDAEARARALDPARSFIVQAPAGSGKTELLIQRYLVLLAVVERPEEVLAITFTRKAAGEMKRRVLDALARARRVAAGADPEPVEVNERMTLGLARGALARDAAQGWRMEQNTARLRIQTIDGFCASLTRQMPVLARFGAQPRSVEDARDLHREAARRTLALLESEPDGAAPAAGPGSTAGAGPGMADHVARVLEHLDNNAAVLEELLAAMLARRDQWLRNAGSTPDRAALEAALAVERTAILREAAVRVPAQHQAELVALATYAEANLSAAATASPITGCAGLVALPAADESGAPAWAGLAALLLTGKNEWRRKVDKRGGFPSGDSKAEKAQAKAWKERHAAMCAELADVPGLLEALTGVTRMPGAAYSDAQWEALSAIVALLPMAAAQLKLVFAERGEVDFTEVAQGAVRALGDIDAPTDLLLSLDVRLRHILVDEFQDTSISQFELVERLTAGWTGGDDVAGGDGRTLFLVGDPMQSIYRFREAEVRLFLLARRAGIGALRLAPLALSTNFRSQAGVVDWVNDAFTRIFPAADDENTSAVGYAASSSFHARLQGEAVSWHAFAHDGTPQAKAAARAAEAQRVVELVRSAQVRRAAAGNGGNAGGVAILVRGRSHLAWIVPALKAAGLRFRAIDIEQLHEKQVVQDLLALTRALAHPGDRVAWLACLRAPWCGLTLSDLLALCGGEGDGAQAPPVILDALHAQARLARLGADAHPRVARLRAVLDAAYASRMRGALRDRVEGAWLALGGPACVESGTELEDAAMFLDMLETLDEGGDVADPAMLEVHLDRLFAQPDMQADASLQVMTIHKAKGLQFDTVILPGLDRGSRRNDLPLLQWKLRPAGRAAADGPDDFRLLLAPIKEAGERAEPIGAHIARLTNAEEDAESARLLYVAVTRAASRLHLLAAVMAQYEAGGPVLRAPPARSLLAKCWPVAQAAFLAQAAEAAEAAQVAQAAHTTAAATQDRVALSPPGEGNAAGVAATGGATAPGARLMPGWLPPEPPPAAAWPRSPATRAGEVVEFEWVSEALRHVGSVVHRWLQRMAEDGLAGWSAARVEGLQPAFRRQLAARGVAEAELAAAVRRVRDALANALDDPRGRWLLGPQPGARNELRITFRVPAKEAADPREAGEPKAVVASMIVDRTFIDHDGRRWIVDYKTSSHEGADVEGFLDREQARYRDQLARYALALAAPGEQGAGADAEASDRRGARLGLYFPLLRGWREWADDEE